MFDEPAELTPASLMAMGQGAKIYLEPTCFVERPHGLDGRCLRISDTMVWFMAWRIRARVENDKSMEVVVFIDDMNTWMSGLSGDLLTELSLQLANVTQPRAPLKLGDRTIRLNEPRIMGILNVTPDSFSDGGKHPDIAAAADAAFAMAKAGAAIIDIGGESTRPGAPLVWEGDEINRVIPVIEAVARGGTIVSIDTRKAAVMDAGLAAGASIINDISALLYDERALAVAVKAECPVILMHAPSQSSDPHAGGGYSDALLDIFDWLKCRIAAVIDAGVAADRIVIDPGLGFGKSVADNLALVNGLALFHALGSPIVFGASRKRMIGALDDEAVAADRLGGSLALAYQAASVGVQILRVHDVCETRQAIRIWRGLRDAALCR